MINVSYKLEIGDSGDWRVGIGNRGYWGPWALGPQGIRDNLNVPRVPCISLEATNMIVGWVRIPHTWKQNDKSFYHMVRMR